MDHVAELLHSHMDAAVLQTNDLQMRRPGI